MNGIRPIPEFIRNRAKCSRSLLILFTIITCLESNTLYSQSFPDYGGMSMLGWIGLTARDPMVGDARESYIIINTEATNGFDPLYDLEFSPGPGPDFYSLSDEKPLSTNCIPSLEESSTISFVFIPKESGEYEVEVAGLDMIQSQVFLYDNQLKSDHNFSQEPVYYFSSDPSDDPMRFLIHFKAADIPSPKEQKGIKSFYYDECLYYTPLTAKDQLILTDFKGRCILDRRSTGTEMTGIPIHLSPGVYILRSVSGNQIYSSKILVR